MKTLFKYLILLALIKTVSSCGGCFTDPEDLRLKIIDGANQSLLGKTYKQQDIRLYQLQGKDTVNMKFFFYTFWDSTVYLSSSDLSWTASGKNKVFYLELSRNDVDTIFADMREKHWGTCTYYQCKKLLINGRKPPVDRDNTPDVYVLRK